MSAPGHRLSWGKRVQSQHRKGRPKCDKATPIPSSSLIAEVWGRPGSQQGYWHSHSAPASAFCRTKPMVSVELVAQTKGTAPDTLDLCCWLSAPHLNIRIRACFGYAHSPKVCTLRAQHQGCSSTTGSCTKLTILFCRICPTNSSFGDEFILFPKASGTDGCAAPKRLSPIG